MSDHRNLNIKERSANRLAEQVLVALVVWVSHQCHTGRQKFWASSLDEDFAIWPVEANAVIGARLVAVFEFGLCNGGAKRDVPKGWGHRLIGLTAGKVIQECFLRNCLSCW